MAGEGIWPCEKCRWFAVSHGILKHQCRKYPQLIEVDGRGCGEGMGARPGEQEKQQKAIRE